MHQIYCPKFWSRWLFCAVVLIPLHANAYSSQDSGRITLHVTNQPIEKVFRQIESQTGYAFFYGYSTLDPNSLVSISADRYRLSQVMDILLKGRNVAWRIKDNGIVLSKKQGADVKINSTYTSTDTLPKVTIKGSVSSEDGFFLPGATVQIRGTAIGTVTNSQGGFTLNGVSPKSILIISYTGYQFEQFLVKEDETLIVRLKKHIGSLDEQVVIAYGTSSRRLLTGSVGRITAKDIEKQPVSNPISALYGRVPGLIITQQTGVPGGNFKVEIRGQNSLRNLASSNGNIPLYIIDGIPFSSTPMNTNAASNLYPNTNYPGSSPFNNINPADIESIEILKDADATAIYGSRGANGVILITTKKGIQGKMQANVNVYTGIGTVSRKMKLLNTQQYIEMRKEAFKNDGINVYPASAYDINGAWDSTKYTDWQKELLGGRALSTDAQMSLSGGSASFQYRFGGGYHKENTVFPGDFSDSRYSAHLSLSNVSYNKKFKTQFTASYSSGLTNLLTQDLTFSALTYSPNAPDLLDRSGNLNWPTGVLGNPLQYLKKPYNAKSKNLVANASLQYELIKGLTIKSNFGYVTSTRKEISKTPISSYPPAFQTIVQNVSSFGNSSNDSWIVEPQINYRKSIGRNNLAILIGSTFQNQESESLYQIAGGFTSELLMNNIGAVPNASVSKSFSYFQYRYNAFFGRINYDFSEKYLLTLTGRRDGSSRFGPGKQFANFGSLGLAWVFSNEKFVSDNLPFLSFGKLRGSYGITGSDQTTNYGFLDLYTPATSYAGQIGIGPKQLFNPDYAWEINKKFEVALETGFLKDKILFNAAYYKNRSSNQLVGYPLPPTTGFSSVQYNLDAIVQNTGLEFEVRTINVDNDNVAWKTFLNLSIPRNKLVSYPNLAASSYANTYVVGEPLSITKLYKYLGVNAETGFYQVEDVDKNGVFNSIDMQYIKYTGSRYYGGIGSSLRWKDFNLDILFQFTKQEGRDYLSIYTTAPGASINQPVEVMNRWKSPSDITNIQKFTQSGGPTYNLFANSDASIGDASFIRFKNLSLSYTISPRMTEKLRLQTLRLYMQGQNLFTITKYKGLDPETQGASLPPLRVLTAGIQVTL